MGYDYKPLTEEDIEYGLEQADKIAKKFKKLDRRIDETLKGPSWKALNRQISW